MSIAAPPSVNRLTATLTALTGEAQAALGSSEVPLTHFPVKVGRDKRLGTWQWPRRLDRRAHESSDAHDLYLIEQRDHPYISRDHFLVERVQERFYLVDRASLCGTMVSDTLIGGYRRGGRTELRHGDVIVIGTAGSPYVYRFDIAGEPDRDAHTGT